MLRVVIPQRDQNFGAIENIYRKNSSVLSNIELHLINIKFRSTVRPKVVLNPRALAAAAAPGQVLRPAHRLAAPQALLVVLETERENEAGAKVPMLQDDTRTRKKKRTKIAASERKKESETAKGTRTKSEAAIPFRRNREPKGGPGKVSQHENKLQRTCRAFQIFISRFSSRSPSPRRKRRERSPAPRPTKIHIGHLTRNVTKDHLMEIFSVYGQIKLVDFAVDKQHPQHGRGFAYVEFETADEAENAMKHMDGGIQIKSCSRVTISQMDHLNWIKMHIPKLILFFEWYLTFFQ